MLVRRSAYNIRGRFNDATTDGRCVRSLNTQIYGQSQRILFKYIHTGEQNTPRRRHLGSYRFVYFGARVRVYVQMSRRDVFCARTICEEEVQFVNDDCVGEFLGILRTRKVSDGGLYKAI